MGALADEYIRVRADTSRMPAEVKRGGALAGAGFASSFGSSTKKALKRGLIATGVAAGIAFGGALKKGFGRLSAIEEAEAKLDGLGHSAKTVDKIMVNALKSVKGTAFGLDEAATVAASSVAAGIKPGKELERTLGLIGDAATIGGASLGEMGAIFNEVAASNKVQGDVINQLTSRGIPILKLLGDVMGKSQGEVRELASKGKIDFATFQKAMEKGLGGAALKSGNTASGAFKNMGAAFSRVGAALLKGVFPKIGAGFNLVTKFLDAITPAAARFGELFGGALTKAAEGVGMFIAAFKTGKTEDEGTWFESIALAARDLGIAFQTHALPALRQFGGFIKAVVIPAAVAWVQFMASQWMPIIRQIGTFFLTSVLPAFRTVVGFIITNVVPGFLQIVETIKGLYAVVFPIISQIVGVIVGKFTEMRPQIMQIWNSIKEIITGVMFIIREVITAVTVIIQMIWARWGEQIKMIVGTVFKTLFNIIAGLMRAIAGIIKLVVALIKGDWSGAWNAIKQIFSGVWQAIKAILLLALALMKVAFTNFTRVTTAIWNGLWGGVKRIGGAAIDWVLTKVRGVLDKIKAAFQTAKDNISRVWSGVKDVVSKPITWIKDHVYNTPLVPVWNRVADLVSGPKLSTFSRGGIDSSGVRPGYTPGRDTHLIGVGGGEAIMRPEWTRAVGKDWIDKANRAARTGKRSLDDFLGESTPGKGAGLASWAKGLASSATGAVAGLAGKLKSWALGGLRDLAGKLLDPLKGVIGRAMPNSGVGNTVGGIGKKAIDLILDKIKKDDLAAMPALGGPAGSAIASGGWASIYKILRAAGARSFTTYAGHDQGASRSRDVWPPSQRVAEAARRLSSVWYVIYNRRIASITHGRRWIPYHGSNPHTDHVHVTLRPGVRAALGGIVGNSGMLNGGIVKGGRGGINALIGEGKNDELVAPLPRGWKAGGGGKPKESRPLHIRLDLAEDLRYYVQGVIDDNDEFHATMGRLS